MKLGVETKIKIQNPEWVQLPKYLHIGPFQGSGLLFPYSPSFTGGDEYLSAYSGYNHFVKILSQEFHSTKSDTTLN